MRAQNETKKAIEANDNCAQFYDFIDSAIGAHVQGLRARTPTWYYPYLAQTVCC